MFYQLSQSTKHFVQRMRCIGSKIYYTAMLHREIVKTAGGKIFCYRHDGR